MVNWRAGYSSEGAPASGDNVFPTSTLPFPALGNSWYPCGGTPDPRPATHCALGWQKLIGESYTPLLLLFQHFNWVSGRPGFTPAHRWYSQSHRKWFKVAQSVGKLRVFAGKSETHEGWFPLSSTECNNV